MENTMKIDAAYASILNTAAVNGAYEHPTPNVEWACAGIDPETFFPTTGAELAEAVAICAGCPVQDICRSIAQARNESGVWGGVLLAEGVVQDGIKKRGRPPKLVAVA